MITFTPKQLVSSCRPTDTFEPCLSIDEWHATSSTKTGKEVDLRIYRCYECPTSFFADQVLERHRVVVHNR